MFWLLVLGIALAVYFDEPGLAVVVTILALLCW